MDPEGIPVVALALICGTALGVTLCAFLACAV